MYIASIICSTVLLLIVFIAVAEKCTVSIFSHSIGPYRLRAISAVHFHLHLIFLCLSLSISFFFLAVFATRRCQFLAAHSCQSRLNSITICLGCCYSICGRLRTTGELPFLCFMLSDRPLIDIRANFLKRLCHLLDLFEENDANSN